MDWRTVFDSGDRSKPAGDGDIEYLREAVPFAFDGGGGFYLFDMRREPVEGEYAIVYSHAGSLGWDDDDCTFVAESFPAACRGTAHPAG